MEPLNLLSNCNTLARLQFYIYTEEFFQPATAMRASDCRSPTLRSGSAHQFSSIGAFCWGPKKKLEPEFQVQYPHSQDAQAKGDQEISGSL